MPTYPFSATLTNPGAESGDTSGWTVLAGFTADAGTQGTGVHSGTYQFFPGNVASASMYQDWSVDASLLTDIDAGKLNAQFQWWNQHTNTDADTMLAIIDCLDNSGNILSRYHDGYRSPTQAAGTWFRSELNGWIPPNTRTIRVWLRGVRNAGTQLSVLFDDVTLDIRNQYTTVPTTLTVTNNGAETGDLTGWTVDTGGFQSVALFTGDTGMGTKMFQPTAVVDASMHQDITLPAGIASQIAAGTATFKVACLGRSFDTAGDQGQLVVQFLDNSNVQQGSDFTNGALALFSSSLWQEVITSGTIPTGSTKMRIKLVAHRTNGTNNDAYFDNINAWVFVPGAATPGRGMMLMGAF